MKKQWLEKLKIAIIEEDFNQIDTLTSTLPNLDDMQSLQECSALINEAIKLVKNEKNRTKKEMELIKKNRAFLQTQKLNMFEEVI